MRKVNLIVDFLLLFLVMELLILILEIFGFMMDLCGLMLEILGDLKVFKVFKV